MKLPGNMQQMMQQAQRMQEKMQQEIALIKVEATAGGGMVTVQMDGQKNLTSVKIDPGGRRRCRDAAGHDPGRR